MKRTAIALAALGLLLGACSDSDSDDTADAATTQAPTTAAAATEAPTTAAPTTEAPTTEAPTTAAPTTEAATGASVDVEMVEWAVNAPTEIASGSTNFSVSNGGENTHEFVIVRGESYDTLPKLDNGAVDEDALGADVVGRTDKIPSGGSADMAFDLEPGSYVFLCNIQFGPNSHAAAGQVLSVTVAG
jgi:ABC-type glycerol-3-phosphate transport system substrate-binding protein